MTHCHIVSLKTEGKLGTNSNGQSFKKSIQEAKGLADLVVGFRLSLRGSLPKKNRKLC